MTIMPVATKVMMFGAPFRYALEAGMFEKIAPRIGMMMSGIAEQDDRAHGIPQHAQDREPDDEGELPRGTVHVRLRRAGSCP